MPNFLAGPGQGLPLPQNLFPSELANAPQDLSNPYLSLKEGDSFVLPSGDWYVHTGNLSVVQYLDPVTGVWRIAPGAAIGNGGVQHITSDGFTCRLANLTGCPVAAIIANGGTGYVQASTTVVPSAGNSTWSPIVGGALSVSSVVQIGGNYGLPPLVAIPAPPPGGVPATAIANINGGTVSGVTLTNLGAGYTTIPTAVIIPNPFDPNLSTGITQASVTFTLANTGAITAVLCTNNGASLANLATLTLSAAGAGSGATITPVIMQTVKTYSIAPSLGGGWGSNPLLVTVGGVPTQAEAIANPALNLTNFRPRPAQAQLVAAGSITGTGTMYDTGLFVGTPLAVLATNTVPTTAATVTLGMGGLPDTILIQPAP